MPDITVQVNRDRRGGLDTNSDEYNIQGGNYPDRVNVERNNDGTYGSDTPTLGTEVVYTIPNVSLQNQRTRIYLAAPFFSQATIELKNVRGQIIRFSNPTSAPTLTANKIAIRNAITAWGLSAVFDNDTNLEPYIDVEVDVQYSDFDLVVTNQLNDSVYRTRIIREAISETGAGPLYLIGSREVNSLNVMCYTSQTKEREVLKNIVTVQNLAGAVVIEAPGHGLQNNESIILARMGGAAAAFNGEWTVSVLDTSFFRINFAVAGALPITPTNYGGLVYSSPYGYGCFIFQNYNPNSDSYEYSIPLRSKRLNWSTLHQIDIDIKFFNKLYACQIADNYNRPRTVYFDEAYFNDSAIEAINPNKGRYDYETLSLQIKTQQDYSGVTVSLREQRQSGGSLDSGGWLYGTLLVTDELTETELSDLTDIAFVYEPTFDGTTNVFGTYGPTNKANSVQVDNISPGIFKYIDLVAVYVSGSENNLTATEAFVVSRTQLGPDQTSITLDHTGNEIDIRGFDLLQVANVRTSILRNKCNVYGENRLLIANYTTSQQFDISEWLKTVKYGIRKFGVFSDFGAENVNGFAQPFISPNRNGYQMWEWYRFYMIGEFLEGGETDASFAIDVRFVTQQDYTSSFGTDDDFRFLQTNETDRRDFGIDDFITYDLGDANRNLFQLGVEFSIDWDFQIDGTPVKDIFRRIKVCRAERIPEVLSMGVAAPSKQMVIRVSSQPILCQIQEAVFGKEYSGTWNFADIFSIPSGFPNTNGIIDSFQKEELEQIVTYYSPDLLLNSEADNVLSGDVFIHLGTQKISSQTNITFPTGSFPRDCSWDIYSGELGGKTQATIHEILDSFTCDFGSSVTLPSNDIIPNTFEGVDILFSKAPLSVSTNEPLETPLSPEYLSGNKNSSWVYFINSKMPQSVTPFLGVHNVLRFRRRQDKYGNTSSSTDVVFTGFYIDSIASSVVCFGGDVYTQQTWFRQTFAKNIVSNSQFLVGGGAGFNIISQNRLNTQLRTFDLTNTTNPAFPALTPFNTWILSQERDQITKNAAYSVVKNQQYKPVFDPNAIDRSEFPTRIIASESSPNGSVKDFNRVFLPSVFRDNPVNFGSITHLDIKQGELFSLQELCYTREFLLENGRLGTIESGNVIIGDGAVLSRSGIRLTQLGSKHKWSYGRGYTDAGSDVRWWVNSDFFNVLRSGADGTVNLTTRTLMDTYMREHMRFVRDKYEPAHGQGIHTTWDSRGKNIIITARGWKDSTSWGVDRRYVAGNTVTLGELYGIPIIYECLVNNTSSTDNEPGTITGEAFWSKKDFSDTNYYSLWTLCFNEQVNRFTHFCTFYPRIYTNHFDRFFSPNPKDGLSGELNLHREGPELVFYGDEHEGFTEYVINYQEFAPKIFVAMAYNAILAPFKVVARTLYSSPNYTQDRVTEMVRDEFTFRENSWRAPIKRSKNDQGETNKDTERIVGFWLRIKTFFKAREKQKINDIFVATRIGQKTPKNP